jgi:hypothetical protein
VKAIILNFYFLMLLKDKLACFEMYFHGDKA